MLQIRALVENIDLANSSPSACETEVTLGFSCQVSSLHDKTKTWDNANPPVPSRSGILNSGLDQQKNDLEV
jgi:hypothetical protein